MTANGRTLQDSLRLAQDENARLASALESSDNSSAPRLKPIKLEAAKFSGAESDKLLRWLLHVKTASDALGISDQATRVALAMSYLKGCAEDWAFSKRLTDFPSFAAFKNELKAMFLRLNSDFRPEHTQVFRSYPQTFEDAVRIALSESCSSSFRHTCADSADMDDSMLA
ncbi:hypothetical protein DYB25_004894 [Aphanomyces astaci]|uniref:Retrotransposon gag domain-containing protein n=1 Tax=Aphanomyces astaci TaxID=112090 RepID=A0A397BFY1_APHAT|nr:hypothetical protein DYB36_001776 [Aphanomyces astaci]RHY19644.1 hypothetical protein DYB25_004894 [Aphanomyces astaci]RHY36077.1 hypothetical protein DYB38_009383 [Aphanomyces astaci]RHY84473.1 hypothetical protein DYB26_009942 [Aphanomyces astaci]